MTADNTAAGPSSATTGTGPIVTGVGPASGPTAGGTVVAVTGSGFTNATAVSFGQIAALDLSVASDTQLTVTSPPAAASGAVDVTVITPAGTSAASAAGQFTYLAAGLMFLSWYRTGLGAAVQPPATGAPLDTAPPAAVTATVNANIGDPDNPGDTTPGNTATGTLQVRLHAPGDVTGLDAAQIARTYPTPGAVNVPSDSFPLIEFAHPNVPWLLSPTGPQQNKPADTDPRRGLTPWLCLVVVPEPPATLTPPASPGGLPTLTVTDSELPDVPAARLWAHAQWMTLATDDPTQTVAALISQHGERALSRLLAPRYLQPNTPYLACVVPTFAPPNGAATLSPAWEHSTPPKPVTLPVYYSWRFTTGPAGDFLSLVKQLKRWDQGGVGIRPLDVGDAGAGMPSPLAGQGPWLISLEGALVSGDVVPGAWTDPQTEQPIDPETKYQLQQALAVRLNGTQGELTPPVYGSTQASFRGPLSAPVPVSGAQVAGASGPAAGQAPSVTGVSPPSGSAAGDDSVTVTGSGFTGATMVNFGIVQATGLVVASDTQLTVTSPAAAVSGPVNVTVTTPNGTSATSPAGQFTYVPAWLRTLNLDPRYRAAAALGADLVRANQDALVLSAWDQAGQARAANQVLRQGQLARELGQSGYTRRIGSPGTASPPMDDDRLLQLTQAVHGQIPAPSAPEAKDPGQATVAGALAANPAAAAVVSVPFRRIASPAGPLASRLTTAPLPPPVTSVAKPNGITPTPPLSAVTGMIDLAHISDPANPETLQALTPDRVRHPTLPWEPGAAAQKTADTTGQPNLLLQPGYLADLWVLGSALGQALDWDGTALLGWTDPPTLDGFTPGPVAIPGGPGDWWTAATTRWNGGAACLISWDQQGISAEPAAAVAHASVDIISLIGDDGVTGYQSNINLDCELAGDAIPGVQNPPVQPVADSSGELHWPSIGGGGPQIMGPGIGLVAPVTLSPAVGAGDLTGSGKPSIALASSIWPAGTTVAGEPFGGVQVGVNVDVDVNGTVGQRLGSAVPGASGDVQGAALANGRVFVLCGGQLWSAPVDAAAGTIGTFTQHAWWGQNLPDNTVWATITAADFTGTGSADLLCFYAIAVPGSEGAEAYRATYRIAYQPDANGEPAYCGDEVGAPAPVTGIPTSLVLGPIAPQTATVRQTVTQAFRTAATATQTRLTSVIPTAASPPPPPSVDISGLASAVRAGVDPQATVPPTVTQRLSLPGDLGDAGGDVLQPLAFTPSFPQPFFETVRDGALPRLIPGLSSFPDEAITVLGADTAVIEAILGGANHELSRELLWRGVPALHTATFFARFWDRRDATGNPLPDITGISAWPAESDLGSHAPAAAGELAVLVWRGELVRRFPHVTIYAAPAVPAGSKRTIDLATRIDPLFTGTLGGDSAFAGFPFTVQDALSGTGSLGKYFVFQEHPTAPRFGLNVVVGDPASYGTAPDAWRDLDWAATVPDQAHYEALTYLDASQASPLWKVSLPDTGAAGATSHQWGFSAAHMAHITSRPPVLIAIHADDLLVAASPGGA
jgi:hypothetical protein